MRKRVEFGSWRGLCPTCDAAPSWGLHPVSSVHELIPRVCGPCNRLIAGTSYCSILRHGGSLFLALLDKRCQPRDFVARFLARHLSRRYGHDLVGEADDITQKVFLELADRPPAALEPPDLDRLYAFLAECARLAAVEHLRQKLGRVRCGNCSHHRLTAKGRACHHPDPTMHWSGRAVRASEDPRLFAPPCREFVSKRQETELPRDLSRRESSDRGTAELERRSRARILREALVAVQKQDAQVAFVLYETYFEEAETDEIARQLELSERTVRRYRRRGLRMLNEELRRRGIGDWSHL